MTVIAEIDKIVVERMAAMLLIKVPVPNKVENYPDGSASVTLYFIGGSCQVKFDGKYAQKEALRYSQWIGNENGS